MRLTQCSHLHLTADDPVARQIGLGAVALRYAALGFAVVPLARGLKKPHRMLPFTGGVHHASRDPQQIGAWWALDPAANIGIATGSASRLAVVDLDVKRGDDGPGNFARFLAENRLVLPAGPYVNTPSGGAHIWLRTPAGVAVPERKILPGVEIKGDGGLVVVPPSMQLIMPSGRDGERVEPVPVQYRWAYGCPCQVPEVPEWFMSWITTAPPGGTAGGAGTGTAGEDIDAEKIIKNGAPVGERNNTLYRFACSRYRKYGTSGQGCAQVIEELRAAWQAGDTSGLPWREVLTIAGSARNFIDKQMANEQQMYNQFLAYLDGAR